MIELKFFFQLFLGILITINLCYTQSSAKINEKSIDKVIAAMTYEEKVSMVMGTGMEFPDLPPEMQGPSVGQSSNRVPGAAGNTFAITRLGIPSIVLADGPAGLRIAPFRDEEPDNTFHCTAFPIATLLASSWNKQVVERVGKAIGEELKGYGVDILLAPALNIHRNPLGGRNFEYYSEDPLISGEMTAAIVKGVQSQGVGSTIKHFVANNHEWNRYTINIIANERALREIYLRGFEIAITESQPWAIMTSYNKINGTYTSESRDLLTDVLRKDWKFEGFVMTDWFGGKDAISQIVAGNDLLMPGTKSQREVLLRAVKNNELSENILDRNIKKILKIILRTPSYHEQEYTNDPNLEKHARICRDAATEGMVLLKNGNGTLPLARNKKIALLGNSSYNIIIGGTGSGDVNEAYTVSLLEGLKNVDYDVDAELAKSYINYIKTEKDNQEQVENEFMLPPPIPEKELSKNEIDNLARENDLALLTIGRNSGEFADRKLKNDFYLSDQEQKLIDEVCKSFHNAGKKVVIVLNIGGVIEMDSWRDKVDAILLAWQPGQEAGNAIVDVISGKVNPSGKLATTFPLDFADIPSSSNFPGTVLKGPDPEDKSPLAGDRAAEVIYKDGIWVGYRYFNTCNKKIAYPFGYGLSYTNFKYSDLELSSQEFHNILKVDITITNIGKLPGKEIAQLYLSAPKSDIPKPSAELKDFAKTDLLQPGESETLTFKIDRKDLASFKSSSSSWIVDSGKYILHIGASSRDIRKKQSFNKKNSETIQPVSKSLIPENNVKEIDCN